jgi:hypothetical protein
MYTAVKKIGHMPSIDTLGHDIAGNGATSVGQVAVEIFQFGYALLPERRAGHFSEILVKEPLPSYLEA